MKTLKDPFTLDQRKEGGPYWVRFSLKGQGQIRKALETTDPTQAHHAAMEVWGEAKARANSGLTVKKHPVASVVERWCEQLDLEVERGTMKAGMAIQHKGIATRYIAGFWDQQPIDTINEVAVNRFWEWRYGYWSKGPGKSIKYLTYMRNGRSIRRPVTDSQRIKPTASSIGTEGVVLRTFLKYAKRNGLINDIPDIEIRKTGKPNARPSFSADEFTRLEELSLERLTVHGLHPAVRRDRPDLALLDIDPGLLRHAADRSAQAELGGCAWL